MTITKAQRKTVNRAIEAMGGLVKTAELLGVTIAAVQNWRARGLPLPKVKDIEKATGIPRAQLRPDIYA